MRRINVDLLVGTYEVTKILGLSDSRIGQLVKGDPTFPEPVHRVRATPLWLATEIEHWGQTRVKRKPGRKSLKEREVQEAAVRLLKRGTSRAKGRVGLEGQGQVDTSGPGETGSAG